MTEVTQFSERSHIHKIQSLEAANSDNVYCYCVINVLSYIIGNPFCYWLQDHKYLAGI